MKEPHFTIISVVKNDAEGIINSRSSLNNQTFKNWTHVIVDGKSTDGTFEWISNLPSVKTEIISELDLGIYDAMNKGLALIDLRSYAIFLNAGDIFVSSEALQTLAKRLIEARFPEIICSTHEEIDPEGDKWVCKLVSKPSVQNQLYAYGYRSHQGVFMRGSLIAQIGNFNLRYEIASDWDWIIRGFLKSTPSTMSEPIIRFETGGFSSQNLLRAHQELRELRSIYLWKIAKDRLWDDIYCAIYLRDLGYKNYLSYFFHFMYIPGKTFNKILRKMIVFRANLNKTRKLDANSALNWKGVIIRYFFRALFFNPYTIIPYSLYTIIPYSLKVLHKKLQLEPLDKA